MHYTGVVAQLANWFGEFILTIVAEPLCQPKGQILPNGGVLIQLLNSRSRGVPSGAPKGSHPSAQA